MDKQGNALYVGKAKNLKKRVSTYFLNKKDLGEKTRILVSQIFRIKTITASSEIEALLLEANYIKKYKPRFNTKLIDDKTYPLIKITISDRYPKVLITRRVDDDKSNKSIYFGPYPIAGAMRLVLKTIRKIFPFQSVLNHSKRICLYNHLGLCPCPPVFDSKTLQKEYRANIKHIIRFLAGDTKKVLKDLKKERIILSKNQEFEMANTVQKRIDAIRLVTSGYYSFYGEEINPNLLEDQKQQELLTLKRYLEDNEVFVQNLDRIECYDVSNILGQFATGSMVVFINGEVSTSLYRRFKIRLTDTQKPNDFAMLSEVISRRLTHSEWPFPNLIIVDGGKGQVSSALKVLKNKGFDIPVIGLAKREETIVTSKLKEIRIPKNSPALHLLMRIRDEAHRFAISYHKLLRKKSLIPTPRLSKHPI